MIQRLREEFDSDRIPHQRATEHRTRENCFELACSICNRTLYVDTHTKAELERAEELGLGSDLTCDACEQEYDVLAHSH